MGDAMPMGAGIWLAAWTTMMAAMMLPSASPLVMHWRRGRLGALRLGVEHGAYCIGCCWALLVVLVLAAAMALGWVIAIGLAVAAEKLLPAGPLLGRVGGIALVAAGLFVAA
jgi:predicted metal-binding membrane protein